MLRRRIAVLLAAVFMLAAAVPALAYEQKAVTIHYDGISLKLDGEYLTPKDAAGATVSPFVLSGTTYLPIRAVASALGLGVEWEQETQTIHLTSGAEADRTPGEDNTEDRYVDAVLNYPGITIYLDGEKLEPRDVTGAVVDPFVISGTTYLPIRAVASALGLGVDWDGVTKTVLLYSDPQQGQPEPQETPEISESPLGELTGTGYTNTFFGVQFAPPAGWTMAEAEDFAEAARELTEDGSAEFTLAESGLLSEVSLSIGNPELPADLPTDPETFYPALAALLEEEDGFSLSDITGLENVRLTVEVTKFAGQDAVRLHIEAPLPLEGLDLGLTMYSELIFLWKAPYMMMIQTMGMDQAGFEAALNGFSAIS